MADIRDSKNWGFETKQLHIGQEKADPVTDARAVPIYASTSYVFHNSQHAADRFGLRDAGNIYGRLTNPTEDVFEQRIAALEGGVAALAVASGAAAINYTFQALAKTGEHIVASKTIYGGTYNLLAHTLPQTSGITATFVDPDVEGSFEAAIQENTKAIFIETLGNPNSNLIDIEEVAKIAHKHNIPLVVDSTFATPYLVRPIEYGADVVIHSSSKYINGSGNSISGIIVDGGKFKWDKDRYPAMKEYSKYGKFAYTARLRNDVWRNMGGCLAPMNAYLNILGLETLGIRMKVLCQNALTLAKALEELAGITVNYPGLESSPYKPLVDKQFGGLGGAILTIRAGSREKAFKLINSLKYAHIATNIGDLRTLVIHPSSTIYLHSTKEEQEHAGVYEDTIRISVGIEDVEDLIADFTQAIENI
mgnify:CR=1 FL=1